MFLQSPRNTVACNGFPRIRGDVPVANLGVLQRRRFSPHTRGCSQKGKLLMKLFEVFPAYAGMFLRSTSLNVSGVGFPRIRGDVPFPFSGCGRGWAFSPHTRGCSCSFASRQKSKFVFPAYAGMFLGLSERERKKVRFPRIRGDVPYKAEPSATSSMFSPHTRGCSSPKGLAMGAPRVFPAYAGMFPGHGGSQGRRRCFPRIRGDVPRGHDLPAVIGWFSPHTRGCSLTRRMARTLIGVFPAYAGMFRFA